MLAGVLIGFFGTIVIRFLWDNLLSFKTFRVTFRYDNMYWDTTIHAANCRDALIKGAGQLFPGIKSTAVKIEAEEIDLTSPKSVV
jgi:hypothetical protein